VDGLSRALVGLGHTVTVLTTDAMDETQRVCLPKDRDHHGVRVLTAPNLANGLAYRHQLFLPRGVADLLAAVDDVDVVHLHGHRHLLNNAAVRWARSRGVPYVLTANGTLLRHERKIGLKWAWDQLVSGSIPGGASRLIAVSSSDVARHRQAGVPADKIIRIPNGLDLGEFKSLPAKGSFRSKYGLGPGPIVAYLGRVSPRKGVEHLVAAFAEDAMAPAQLVVAGNDMGGMDTAVAAQRGGGVHFVGLVQGEDRLALLADTDVLVYPSADEVFGLVPFEGLLCGAPVVVADDCGCGELIAEAGAGLLVRYGDEAGLRARIRTLLEDREAGASMVARGRKYVNEQLSFQPVALRHVDLYQSVCV
jgi:glycosyltransferase involved in cell wall biosynthesis